MYVRKHIRAKAIDNKAFSRSLRIASKAWFGTQYEETKDGYRVRIWGDPNEDWVTKDDVRAWLTGVRVIEIDNLRSGHEYVRESYIKTMITSGYLRKDGPFYWVTQKAAEYFGLPKVLGCEFPK